MELGNVTLIDPGVRVRSLRQFEVLTCHLNDGNKPRTRSQIGGAHPYVAAPYGIYETSDGFIAIAMGSVPVLGSLLGLPELEALEDPSEWYDRRDEIKLLIAAALRERPSAVWVELLSAAGLCTAEVLSWSQLLAHDAVRQLEIVMDVGVGDRRFRTVRTPIRIDGHTFQPGASSPRLGEHGVLPGEKR